MRAHYCTRYGVQHTLGTPQARYHEDTAPEECCVFGLEAEEAGEEALLLGLLCLAACSFFLLAAGCLFVLCLQVGSCASVADGLHVLLLVLCCFLLNLDGLLNYSPVSYTHLTLPTTPYV